MAQGDGQIDRIEHSGREPIWVNGHEDQTLKIPKRFRRRTPAFRHEMMCFIHQDAMRPSCAKTPLLQFGQQLQKKGRTVLQGKPHQIDNDLRLGIFEGSHHFDHRRAPLRIPKHDHFFHRGIIALGINHATLIALVDQLFENRVCQGRFSAAGRAGDQQIVPYRRHRHWLHLPVTLA